MHTLWKCPCLQHARLEFDGELAHLSMEQLPAHMRLGVPGALHANELPYLWPVPNEQQGDELPHFANLMARRLTATTPNTTTTNNATSISYHLHARMHNALQSRSACEYQLVTASKVNPWLQDIPMPKACAAAAPVEPNVLTDSSFENPTCQNWRLAGMGVWWPQHQ